MAAAAVTTALAGGTAGLPATAAAAAGAALAAVNDRLTLAVAASSPRGIRVLRRDGRTWRPAGVIDAPPGAAAPERFGRAGLVMAGDGRALLVASAPTPAPLTTGGAVTLGYLYRPVTHGADVLAFSLAQRLSLDVGSAGAAASGPGAAALITPRVDLSHGGQAAVVCFTTQQQQQQAPTSGGAAVFSLPADPRQSPTVHVLPLPRGSRSYGSGCGASRDGRVVLVADAGRGALVYSRHAQARSGPHRASGWLPGGAPGERYAVLAAALSAGGRRAALLVQPARGGSALLRLFAADELGAWTPASVCDIAVDAGGAAAAAGVAVSLTDEADGGVHVTVGRAAPDGLRATFAVGLRGTQATHCPQLPVMRAAGVRELAGEAAAAAGGSRAAAQAPLADGAPVVRRGRLQLGDGATAARFISDA